MRPLNKKETVAPPSPSAAPTQVVDSTPTGARVWRVLPSYNSVTQTLPDGGPCKERVSNKTFFSFDKAFGEASSTLDVYNDTAKGIVASVTEGMNGTVFAYGQTSSGKTFTMTGSEASVAAEHPGIVHMATADIFQYMSEDDTRDFLLRVSFIEIYNEETRDLLNESAALTIREDPKRGVYVDAKERIVTSFDQLLGVLEEGEKVRHVGSTSMNERSSRSHTIFRITLESRVKKVEGEESVGDKDIVRVSTLNLVDLAGSESVRLTGASGERQKEGGKINQSLLTLSRVICSLGEAAGSNGYVHVNYRDSKLTRILQPNLSGNSRIAVICCATPSELYLEETRSTLQFASRAKLVKTRAVVNEVLDDRAVIKKLQKELSEARLLAGGKKAIQHLRDLEAERDTLKLGKDDAEEHLRKLKGYIIKGGTLFDMKDDSMPGFMTPAKNRINKRRQTVAPGGIGSTAASGWNSSPVLGANIVVDNRRKSVGTALIHKATPLSPAVSALAKFVNANKEDKNRRLSGGSVASSSSASSASHAASAGNAGASNSEVDLLRQALAAKGQQNLTLKEKLRVLQGDSTNSLAQLQSQLDITQAERDAAQAEKTAIALERDEIGSMCEELMKEKDELSVEKSTLLADKAELVSEKEILMLEKEKAELEKVEGVDAAIADKTTAIADKDSAIEEKTAAIGEKEDAIFKMEEALAAKDAALEEAAASVAKMEEAVAARDAAIAEREAAIVSAAAARETMEQSQMSLSELTAKNTEQVAKYTAEIAAATKKAQQLQFEIDAARDDNEDLLDSVKEKGEVEEQIVALQTELEATKAELLASSEALGGAKNELVAKAEVESQLTSLQAQLAATQAELATASEDLTTAKDELAAASKEASSMSDLLQSSEVDIENYKKEVEDAKAELNDALDMAEDYKSQAENAAMSEEMVAELEKQKAEAAEEKATSDQIIKALKATFCEEKAKIALEFQTATAKIREEVKDLESELSGSQTAEYEYKQQVDDLKESLAAAESSAYESKQQLEDLSDQVETIQLSATAARNAADASGKEVIELKSQLKKLKAESAAAVAKASEAASSSASSSATDSAKVEALKEELESKEARIKKLEAVRLTKDQCAALKKMKEERIKYMSRCKELEAVNEKLKKSAGGEAVDEANVIEIDNLKSRNTELTEKLRKYANHCQKLEGDKAAVVDTMKAVDGVTVEKDFAGSIATLVERLQAAEEECEALASAETRANTYLTQLDRAREDKDKLEETASGLQGKVGGYMEKEKELSLQLHTAEERVAALLEEKAEFIKKNGSLSDKMGEVEGVNMKKVRFLEQENLQLMMDQKQLKRELQGYKAELEAIKVAGLGDIRSPLQPRSAKKDGEGNENVENGAGGELSASATKLRGIAAIAEGNEGLVGDDENTGECKQS
jgi:centromeric protein E